ncbi:hypothetical protein [Erythrobacter sp. QSSC1-22B]|uniref:hypothetical protein n=1 Tax=Erythrobacter sp. QSSC1-22B TaxID=1860125 RepID=UPI0011A58369|nr:hypothetical protein [Erythrobacter sp. QSSC1-22B]
MLQQQERFALPTYALERLSRSGKPETFGSVDDKWRLLVILLGRQAQARKTALRDVHTLLDLPQHVAFRLVRGLELGRLITVGACLHDAFAAELELTEECSTLVRRVLARG